MRKGKLSVSINGGEEINLGGKFINALGGFEGNDHEVKILAASLSTDFCKYKYEIIAGKLKGDGLERTGANIVHEDLKNIFKKLHVHLALACEEIDATKVLDIENIPNWDDLPDETKDQPIKKLSAEEQLSKRVHAFLVGSIKINGTGENEGVIMSGSKTLSTGDLVGLQSPKITWDGNYHFINELRVIIDDIKEEVILYMNGKAAPKMEQTALEFPEGDDMPFINDGKQED